MSESEIWEKPTFPSRPLFKKKAAEAVVNREKQRIANEAARAAAEKQRLEREIQALKAKQQKLEKQLAG